MRVAHAASVLLWILAVLAALVLAVCLLALLLPIRVKLQYGENEVKINVKALCFSLQILPKPSQTVGKSTKKRTLRRQKKGRRPKKKGQPQGETTAAATAVPQPPAEAAAAPKTADASAQTGAEQPQQLAVPQTQEGCTAAGKAPRKAAAPKRDKKQQPDSEKNEKNGAMVQAVLEALPEVVGLAGHFIGAVLHSLKFRDIVIRVPIHADSPDKTARRVGKANAWFYAVAAQLEHRLRLYWQEVCIFPDYTDEQRWALFLQVCISGQLLPIGIAALHAYFGLKKAKVLP